MKLRPSLPPKDTIQGGELIMKSIRKKTVDNNADRIQKAIMEVERPYTMIVYPALLITILFLLPFVWGIGLTFTNYRLGAANVKFTFLHNYWAVLTSNNFLKAAWKTTQFTLLATGIELLLAFGLSVLMNTETIMAKIMRRLISLPLMIAPVVATLALKLMLNSKFGIVNYLMSFFGLRDFPWGASPSTSMFTVILVDIWIFTPFMTLIILAGMRGLPKDPIEAASVDGASKFTTLKDISFPIMLPTILVAFIFRFIDCIKCFDVIWGMTAGGPGDSTTVFCILGYVLSFSSMDIAKGNTILVFVWLINMFLGTKLINLWRDSRTRIGG